MVICSQCTRAPLFRAPVTDCLCIHNAHLQTLLVIYCLLSFPLQAGNDYASDFIVIKPERRVAVEDKAFKVSMKLHPQAGSGIDIYRSNSAHFSSWQKVEATITGDTANFAVSMIFSKALFGVFAYFGLYKLNYT